MRKTLLTIFFIALTVGPVSALLFKEGAFFKERPFLSPPPHLTTASLFERPFYLGLERYLEDRNPFRQGLIRANALVDVRLFRSSPAPNVRMGLHGWLYFKPAMHSLFRDDCKETRSAYTLARRLHNIEADLKKAGKRFVFIVAPDKASIYPEYVGGVPEKNNCGRNFYDLFLLAMKRFPVKGFLRLDEALRKAKRDGLLYYRGGTHWNDRGAAIAAGLILQKLSTPARVYRLPKIKFTERVMLSEDAPMLSVGLFERAPFAEKIEFSEEVATTGIRPLPFFPGEWVLMRTRTRPRARRPLLPKALIYRDSFMTAPIKILKGSFREIYARWSRAFPEARGMDPEELASADIVILEIVERDLERLEPRPRVLAALLRKKGKKREGRQRRVSAGRRE